jgi:hypothetical protein
VRFESDLLGNGLYKKMRPEMVIGMEIEILDGQNPRLFSDELFEKKPAMTIEDFDFHLDDHFESRL